MLQMRLSTNIDTRITKNDRNSSKKYNIWTVFRLAMVELHTFSVEISTDVAITGGQTSNK